MKKKATNTTANFVDKDKGKKRRAKTIEDGNEILSIFVNIYPARKPEGNLTSLGTKGGKSLPINRAHRNLCTSKLNPKMRPE